jgi:hypothetical protein
MVICAFRYLSIGEDERQGGAKLGCHQQHSGDDDRFWVVG